MSEVLHRMKRLHGGSARYGVCEVCSKNVDTTYLISFFRIDDEDGEEVVLNSPASKFGHEKCLQERIENG